MNHSPALELRDLAGRLLAITDRGQTAVVLTLLDDTTQVSGGHRVLASAGGLYGSWGGGRLTAWARALAHDALRQALEAWVPAPSEADSGEVRGGGLPSPAQVGFPLREPVGKEMVSRERNSAGALWRRPGLGLFPREEAPPLKVFLEVYHPQAEWLLVGAGHLAQPLCALGTLLGCRVVVLDDRPDYAQPARFPQAHAVHCVELPGGLADWPLHPWSHVVLITRAHQWDAACLRHLLGRSPQPAYVGMIGSRRRVRSAFRTLLDEGASPRLLQQVHSPIGLDLNAETPAEIAVSVAAEILLATRGGSGRPLRVKENVLRELLEVGKDEPSPGLPLTSLGSNEGAFSPGGGSAVWRRALSQEDRAVYSALAAAEPSRPLALAMVVDARGSTPRGVGAKMLVDGEGQVVAGTVGGGWGEAEIIQTALESLRAARPRLFSLSLNARPEEERGSVCGGTMEVWVEPVR